MIELPAYEYITDATHRHFQFTSVGIKGEVCKIVKFSRIGRDFYNMGFGDYNPLTDDIDHNTRSNNGDLEKIMGTLASIVQAFTVVQPDAIIFIAGSTPSRTRLYQQQISRRLPIISTTFKIFGYIDENWERFNQKRNYRAFCGMRINTIYFTLSK